jgi:high-affinity Fe2+/Pb2+ permease
MAAGGWGTFPTLFGSVTTPAAVGIIVAVVAGVIVVLGTHALGLRAPLAAGLGVLTAVALDLVLTGYARRAYRRWREIHPPVNPTPEG